MANGPEMSGKDDLIRTRNSVSNYVTESGESTGAAKELAEKVNREIEDIKREKSKKRLQLYKHVFEEKILSKDSYDMASEQVVTRENGQKGLLALVEKHSPLTHAAFEAYPDLRMVAYGSVMKGIPNANFLDVGDKVSMSNGRITITRKTGEVESAMLFPWEVLEVVNKRIAELEDAKPGSTPAPAPTPEPPAPSAAPPEPAPAPTPDEPTSDDVVTAPPVVPAPEPESAPRPAPQAVEKQEKPAKTPGEKLAKQIEHPGFRNSVLHRTNEGFPKGVEVKQQNYRLEGAPVFDPKSKTWRVEMGYRAELEKDGETKEIQGTTILMVRGTGNEIPADAVNEQLSSMLTQEVAELFPKTADAPAPEPAPAPPAAPDAAPAQVEEAPEALFPTNEAIHAAFLEEFAEKPKVQAFIRDNMSFVLKPSDQTTLNGKMRGFQLDVMKNGQFLTSFNNPPVTDKRSDGKRIETTWVVEGNKMELEKLIRQEMRKAALEQAKADAEAAEQAPSPVVEEKEAPVERSEEDIRIARDMLNFRLGSAARDVRLDLIKKHGLQLEKNALSLKDSSANFEAQNEQWEIQANYVLNTRSGEQIEVNLDFNAGSKVDATVFKVDLEQSVIAEKLYEALKGHLQAASEDVEEEAGRGLEEALEGLNLKGKEKKNLEEWLGESYQQKAPEHSDDGKRMAVENLVKDFAPVQEQAELFFHPDDAQASVLLIQGHAPVKLKKADGPVDDGQYFFTSLNGDIKGADSIENYVAEVLGAQSLAPEAEAVVSEADPENHVERIQAKMDSFQENPDVEAFSDFVITELKAGRGKELLAADIPNVYLMQAEKIKESGASIFDAKNSLHMEFARSVIKPECQQVLTNLNARANWGMTGEEVGAFIGQAAVFDKFNTMLRGLMIAKSVNNGEQTTQILGELMKLKDSREVIESAPYLSDEDKARVKAFFDTNGEAY